VKIKNKVVTAVTFQFSSCDVKESFLKHYHTYWCCNWLKRLHYVHSCVDSSRCADSRKDESLIQYKLD